MKKKNRKEKVFQNEIDILNHARSCVQPPIEKEELQSKYGDLCDKYESLIGIAKLLTSVSDRLHLRLDKANKKLITQSEEIQEMNDALIEKNKKLEDTMSAMVRATIGRKASTIVLVIAIILFIISEIIIEPVIENNTDNEYIGYIGKGAIALLLKPIDVIVERYLIRQKMKDHSIETDS
ncbi:MAG: hypothetical protein AAF363_19470 [Bacteroidota bacterium]